MTSEAADEHISLGGPPSSSTEQTWQPIAMAERKLGVDSLKIQALSEKVKIIVKQTHPEEARKFLEWLAAIEHKAFGPPSDAECSYKNHKSDFVSVSRNIFLPNKENETFYQVPLVFERCEKMPKWCGESSGVVLLVNIRRKGLHSIKKIVRDFERRMKRAGMGRLVLIMMTHWEHLAVRMKAALPQKESILKDSEIYDQFVENWKKTIDQRFSKPLQGGTRLVWGVSTMVEDGKCIEDHSVQHICEFVRKIVDMGARPLQRGDVIEPHLQIEDVEEPSPELSKQDDFATDASKMFDANEEPICTDKEVPSEQSQASQQQIQRKEPVCFCPKLTEKEKEDIKKAEQKYHQLLQLQSKQSEKKIDEAEKNEKDTCPVKLRWMKKAIEERERMRREIATIQDERRNAKEFICPRKLRQMRKARETEEKENNENIEKEMEIHLQHESTAQFQLEPSTVTRNSKLSSKDVEETAIQEKDCNRPDTSDSLEKWQEFQRKMKARKAKLQNNKSKLFAEEKAKETKEKTQLNADCPKEREQTYKDFLDRRTDNEKVLGGRANAESNIDSLFGGLTEVFIES